VWGGYRGWVLCGHTHGGQCSAPLFGPPLLPVANKRYTSGEFDLFDGRRLYINPGPGCLRRVRFNVPPEITLLTLRPGRAA
jgi:predicted MPP superfamily phosphohydrolase